MNILRQPVFPYVIPFGTFLLFTGLASLAPVSIVWLYPIKTVLVGVLLFMFCRTYTEVKPKASLLAIVAGLAVFVLWVLPEGYYPVLGQPKGFNPLDGFTSRSWLFIWISFRLIGAVLVVPIMEELFWRSFLLRYLVNPDFKKVPLGAFSWLSFCGTVIFFGLEHHRWLPGIVAGIIYTLLLYRKKELFDCILAHAITNLMLGVYVLVMHQWIYW